MFSDFGRQSDANRIHAARSNATVVVVAISTIVAAILLAPDAGADQRLPLSIAEAEDIALRDEPGLLELQATASALNEQSVAVGQLPDPTLRIGLANYPLNRGGFTTEGMTQAQFGFRQAFPRSGLRAMRTARYRALASVQDGNAGLRSRNVLTTTRVAWLESYYWQHAEEILEASRPLFEDLLEVTQSLYGVGQKAQSDVIRAELELRRLDDRLLAAARSRAISQGELSQWLGAAAFRPTADKLPEWPLSLSLEGLRETLSEHPTMIAAQAGIEAKQAQIGMTREKAKPGWALDVAYGYRDGLLPDGQPRSDFVSVSVVVDLPFFKRNRQDRELAAALSERRAAVSGRQRLAAGLESQLNIEYARWSELTRRLALYDTEILGLSRSRAESAMLAYQSDAGDFSDVALGQIEYLDTRLDYLRLQVELAQSLAVLANLGGLSR